ncbi:hypothetical protein ACTI_66190 [Actinoplanes sp. OR16]|nr:hypothetical protein ACTI_66190 [Actinoplanes sp. OR16]
MHYTLTILELGRGRYDAAAVHALVVRRHGPAWLRDQVVPDLIEAVTRGSRRDAIALLPVGADLARTHLVFGEWLRRRQRRRDAREHLGLACAVLDDLGFHAFAGRAAAELRATAERRDAGGYERLTAQETEIARLVAEGHANREIAERLFISPNTVQYHLAKVFRKLGVRSRTQLARAIDPAAAAFQAASRASRCTAAESCRARIDWTTPSIP